MPGPTEDACCNARSRRTHTALLAAAREILERDGYPALTMAAVAEAAGVSRRAVYLHFGSRGELLTKLFGFLGEQEDIRGSLARVWDRPDAEAAVGEWAAHLGRVHPRLLAVNLAIDQARREGDPDATAYWERGRQNWLKGCTRLAGWLEAEGRLAAPWTPASAADMLWALMSFEITEGLLVHRGWTPERYAQHMGALLRAAFVAPPGARSTASDLGGPVRTRPEPAKGRGS
jgi:AcrR family transcriptional regulator